MRRLGALPGSNTCRWGGLRRKGSKEPILSHNSILRRAVVGHSSSSITTFGGSHPIAISMVASLVWLCHDISCVLPIVVIWSVPILRRAQKLFGCIAPLLEWSYRDNLAWLNQAMSLPPLHKLQKRRLTLFLSLPVSETCHWSLIAICL